MAGGAGSRFWPLSNEKCPKQFLDILGCGRSLLQLTVDRFKGIIPNENIWIVTLDSYAKLVKEQLPDIQENNILLEPCRRNTAPCICYVSWKIKKRNPKANVVVTPSDHVVTDIQAFQNTINEALAFASETDSIVTLGIKPTRPETGFGYIKADLSFASSRRGNIYRVDAFKEKPSLEMAKNYVEQPNFLWNSGIFVWSVSTVVNAFRVYDPTISEIFENMLPYYDTPEEQKRINELYPQCENISVDYAIMEKAEEVFVCPATFAWNDLGTWSALHELTPHDQYHNAIIGENINLYDTYHTIVHISGKDKVVVQGLDGFVVVEKDNKLLICKLSEEQRIKLFH